MPGQEYKRKNRNKHVFLIPRALMLFSTLNLVHQFQDQSQELRMVVCTYYRSATARTKSLVHKQKTVENVL